MAKKTIELTKNQEKVYSFIKKVWTKKGTLPTGSEISKKTGVTTSTVYAIIRALREKGLIK